MRDIIWLVVCVITNLLLTATFTTALCPKRKFGRGCRLQCNCRDIKNCKRNENSVSHCYSCEPGFTLPPSCQRQNGALDKAVRSRKDRNKQYFIVDGKVDTCSPLGTWFEVDFGNQYQINTIDFSQETSVSITFVITSLKMNNTDVYYKRHSDVCFISTNQKSGRGKCKNRTVGRYIYGLTSSKNIQLCELTVYVCPDYTYGKYCQSTCACANPYEVCDKDTGECPSGCYLSNATSNSCHKVSPTSVLKTGLSGQSPTSNSSKNPNYVLVTSCPLPTYAIVLLCIAVGIITGTVGIFIGYKYATKGLKCQAQNDNYLVPVENDKFLVLSQTIQAPSSTTDNAVSSVPYYSQMDNDDEISNAPYYSQVGENTASSAYEGVHVSKDATNYIVMPESYEQLSDMPRPPFNTARKKPAINIDKKSQK